jgi:hypothetical protein
MRGVWDRLLNRECRCGFLERAAQEPHCPIKCDPGGNRFFVKYDAQNRTKLLFHNCPACGGKLRLSTPVMTRCETSAAVAAGSRAD